MKIQLEPTTLRTDSTGWKKIDDYHLESPTEDSWEDTRDHEQLHTWDSAMRIAKEQGKRLPTDDELEGMKPEDFAGPLAGYRATDGSFYYRGSLSYDWSSSESGGYAWGRYLDSGDTSVYRVSVTKAFGFSVYCVLETQKTEQCFCKGYRNDDDLLVDCTCGKCEIAGKRPKKEVQDCFTCPHCKELIYYKSKNE